MMPTPAERIEFLRAFVKTFGPIGQAVERLGILAYGLTKDRMWASEQLDVDNEAGSARRVYVRTQLTFVEGMTHAFKDVLLAMAECEKIDLADAEKQMLREVQYQLDGKYRARVVRRPVRTKDYVRFALVLMGRSVKPSFKPDFGGKGWQAFDKAISIRNRVTHPKSRDDHWVSEEDLDTVDEAIEWFEDETSKFMERADLDLLAKAD